MALNPSPLAAACSLLLLFRLLSPSPTAAELVLLPGGTIPAGRALYDVNRNYRLIQQWNCDFAMYDLYDIAWHTDTTGNGGYCRTTLTAGGQLMVVRGDGKSLWTSPQPGALTPQYVLAMQPDRNVVIYSQIVWSSQTGVAYMQKYQYNDQVLLTNDTILFGKYLMHLDLNYQFLLQEDCDLVLYDKSNRIWSTGTAGMGKNCRATLTTDGYLVIQDGDGKTVWKSVNHKPDPKNYAVILKPDRDIVIATGPVWSTRTNIPTVMNEPSSEVTEDTQVD